MSGRLRTGALLGLLLTLPLIAISDLALTSGETFYEGPDDVHVIGRNTGQTAPAKFVVFLVKDKGAPILVPAE